MLRAQARKAVADILQDTPTEAPEEVPSDEEEEFKHKYSANLKMEEGPLGTDIRYMWADPTEQAFLNEPVQEYHYKVRKVLPYLNSVQLTRMGLSMEKFKSMDRSRISHMDGISETDECKEGDGRAKTTREFLGLLEIEETRGWSSTESDSSA